MSRSRAIASLALALALSHLLWGLPSLAGAATLQGTVVAPPAGASPRRSGFWRLENGRLPIAPAPAAHKGGPAAVILVPETAAAVAAAGEPQRQAVQVHSFTIEPRLLVVSRGATLEVHNATKVPRALELVGGPGSRSPSPSPLSMDRPLAPGEKREVPLSDVGEFRVRDPGTPRAAVTVVVVDTPYRALTDEQGEFHIEAPAGKYLLKAYAEGVWTAGEPVEVGRPGAPLRVTLQVTGAAVSAGGGPGQDVRAEGATADPPPGTSAASAGSQGK
ncbi:MAG TPA: hypothetical protein VH877_17925 [Polyangia bacterium]|nr:hypothetical protein [Polyangia bacterium]